MFGCSILHEDVRFALYEHPRAFTSKPRACSYPTWPNIYIKIALFEANMHEAQRVTNVGKKNIFFIKISDFIKLLESSLKMIFGTPGMFRRLRNH